MSWSLAIKVMMFLCLKIPSFKKIAMGNAIEDIKEKADFVTDDNNHNGIAKALKKFVI